MSLGLTLQIIGGVLSVIGIIVGLIGVYISPQGEHIFSYFQGQTHSGSGDNVGRDKIINSIQNLFSETQSIKVLPPSLGGNDRLNLDNVATLKLHVPYSDNSVTLLLDVVVITLPSNTEGPIKTEGVKSYNHNSGTIYLFDIINNKRHEITISDRTFVVTLFSINKLDVPNVSYAIEYEFGISER